MKKLALPLLLVLGYLAWRFVVAGDALVLVAPESGARVTAEVARVLPGEGLVIEILNPAAEQRVTEITMSRDVARALRVGPPAGFREQSLELTEREARDPEMVAFVEEFNRDQVRWVGEHPLSAEARTEMVIPAERAGPAEAPLRFRYERRVGFGGSIAFFEVSLAGIGAEAGAGAEMGVGPEMRVEEEEGGNGGENMGAERGPGAAAARPGADGSAAPG